jgi:hypothetical protein
MRPDGRKSDELRPIRITPDYNRYAEGSVLVEFGETKVICTASVERKVPPFLEGQGKGWITAEYAMLPRSTHTRSGRNPGGRGQEIQRLIGRALRAAINTKNLGERQITVDCDVIQADGGTRTAAITGGWVALALAVRRLVHKENLKKDPSAPGGVRGFHGHRRRRGAPGSGLRRGFLGGCGFQFRAHRRRQFRRDPGHGRGRAVLAGRLPALGGAGQQGRAGIVRAPEEGAGEAKQP